MMDLNLSLFLLLSAIEWAMQPWIWGVLAGKFYCIQEKRVNLLVIKSKWDDEPIESS